MTTQELGALLADVVRESDDNLRATAEFFGLDLEAIEERASVMQHDGGLARVTANRLALTIALPGVSEAMCRWFAQNAATVAAYGRERGLSRDELADELRAYFRRGLAAGKNDAEAIHVRAV